MPAIRIVLAARSSSACACVCARKSVSYTLQHRPSGSGPSAALVVPARHRPSPRRVVAVLGVLFLLQVSADPVCSNYSSNAVRAVPDYNYYQFTNINQQGLATAPSNESGILA